MPQGPDQSEVSLEVKMIACGSKIGRYSKKGIILGLRADTFTSSEKSSVKDA